jgi:hypothetical protein
MGNRDAKGREQRKPKKKEAKPTQGSAKCSHNNFTETRRDSEFKYGFCIDCRLHLKKHLNQAGKEIGEFLAH